MFAPQAPGVLGALAHRLAALQHDGFEAHLRQSQRGEQAAGTQTHHHRALALVVRPARRRLAGRVPGHVGCGLDVGLARVLRQQGGFLRGIGQRHVDDVDREQVGLARVEAAFEDVQVRDA